MNLRSSPPFDPLLSVVATLAVWLELRLRRRAIDSIDRSWSDELLREPEVKEPSETTRALSIMVGRRDRAPLPTPSEGGVEPP